MSARIATVVGTPPVPFALRRSPAAIVGPLRAARTKFLQGCEIVQAFAATGTSPAHSTTREREAPMRAATER